MAQVKDYRGTKGGQPAPKMTTVKVGDTIGFKSDYEQYGTVTRVDGQHIHLFKEGGFGGDYLRHAESTVIHADDGWME